MKYSSEDADLTTDLGDHVTLHTDDPTLTVYSTDNSIYQVFPDAVELPGIVADVQRLLQVNAAQPNPRSIVARGGGTGTNGQSLTDGIMIDLKHNVNQLLAINADTLTAVVEPGMVTAQLNAQLRPHGLFWAPHTSTLNRATVGGMISTDAAGKGSLVHGRAHRHVVSLDVLLADGTPWTAEEVTLQEAHRRATGTSPGAMLWQRLLDLPVNDDSTFALPELARGFSGYGIDRFRRDGKVNPVALLAGAEGTLAIITKATLRLTPLPERPLLAIASYDTFNEALIDAVRLRSTGPTAIESFDETTLDRGRSSPAWPALGKVLGDHAGAVLLLEYTNQGATSSQVSMQISAGLTARSVAIIDDAQTQAQVWKVRADAVGLLAKVATGGPNLTARPTAFVEDCAVPVEVMPAFIAEFRELLDGADVAYGMFGHADVGCVHVRPALDLTDGDQRLKLISITDQVCSLVERYNGLLWGEHGRGFRGSSVSRVLDTETMLVMRAVKSAFDPGDLLNPGKLYRPLESSTPLVEVGEAPLRGERDELVARSERVEFAHAFACNGNGVCQNYDPVAVMCPSYKATGDPALSPKGRADLLREWLRARRGDVEFEGALATNLNQCLSCSACTGQCPVEVDIPELKSQFFSHYHQRHRRPASHALMSHFERLAMIATRAPRLAALGSGPVGRLLNLVDLPTPAKRKASLPAFRSTNTAVDVVLLPDVFTSALDPSVERMCIAVLQRLGYSLAIAPFIGSGKFDHVKGKRDRFAAAVNMHANLVEEILAAKAIPMVIEPAIALLHRHEYPQARPGYPVGVRSFVEVALDRVDELEPTGDGQTLTLLSHCTEQATAPHLVDGYRRLLESAGYVVAVPPVGCCGMAGIFGHETANQPMSKALWDLSWAPAIAAAGGPEFVVASGYSCRSQSARFGLDKLAHPVSFLQNGRQD